MTRLIVVVAVLVALGGGLWWAVGREEAAERGEVTLEWRGAHRGSVTLPGEVAWCPVTRMATLQAIRNDTGLIVTLLEADSLAPVPHPIVAPAVRDQAPRPSAIAALRWASDSGVLHGFQSVSGLVQLDGVGTSASGSLHARMRAPVGFDTLAITATFDDLPVVASAVGCP